MDKLDFKGVIPLTNQEREVYRTLRTNLEFTGVENRVIVITSCTPNDGKSTVAYNLAMTLAENGKNTLLIDADMRKSVLIHRFHVEGISKGLSHFLSGQAEMSEVIYGTHQKNFFLTPTGLFPSNPTELLANARFQKLILGLKETFDYIIIDTPPLGNVIDAAIVAQICDGSILVIAADTSSRAEAKSVIHQLKTANSNFLGVVLNKVDIRTGSYYGKKYGSYYGKPYGHEVY